MSLLFQDSFSHYVTAESSRKLLSGGSTVNTPSRFSGSRSLSNGSPTHIWQWASAEGTVVVGFAYDASTLETFPTEWRLRLAGAVQCYFKINANGSISLHNSGGTQLAVTSTGVVVAASWQYVEVKVVIADSGSCVINVNGSQVLNASSIDTKSQSGAGADQLAAVGQGSQSYATDLYIENANILGPSRHELQMPTANGEVNQWTPDSGSNYARVNENDSTNGMDDDTSYVHSTTAGHYDLYAFSFSATGAAIRSLAVNFAAKMDVAGSRTMKAVVRRKSTDTNYDSSTTFSLTEAYKIYQFIWQVCPWTSSAWTESDLSDCEVGIKLEA